MNEETVEIKPEEVFYLKQRRKIINIEKVKLDIYGANIIAKNGSSLEMGDEIVVSNDKETIKKNTSILNACVSLGRYVYEHSNLLYDLASTYYKYTNLNHVAYVKGNTLLGEDIEDIPKVELKYNYKNINRDEINALEFNPNEELSLKIDEKLETLLLKWFKVCGILELEYYSGDFNHQVINMEHILVILDSCLSFYEFYLEVKEKRLKREVRVNITYSLTQNSNGDIVVLKKVSDILSLAYLSTITYLRYDCKMLKECEYCHELFFGRKNKLCCSQRCKDLKNGKYEKRKLKKANN